MPVKRVQDLDPITKPIEQTDITHIVADGLLGKEDHFATMAEIMQAVGHPFNISYDSLHEYVLYEQTFYNGIPYRSLSATNLGNQPDTSPTFWEVTGGGSGGGGTNFIKNTLQKATTANWAKGSGSYVTAPSWSASQNIYAGGALLLAFTTGAKTANDYFETDFSEIMQSMVGISWKIKFTMFIDTGATFVADDIAVNYFDGTNEVPINYIPISVLNNFIIFESALIPSNVIGTSSKLRFRSKLGSTTCVGNLRIADISVAPQLFVSIPKRSDWIGYTPTFQGLGTVSGLQAEYAFDAGDLIGQVKVTAGTVTAAEMRCDLPSPFTSRSNIPTIQIAGEIIRSAAGSGAFYALIEASKGYLVFGSQTASAGGLTKQNASAMFGNTETFTIRFRIPCAQLSANINLAGLTDPMYLSNSESVANTNGVTGKSFYGIEGMQIPANTAVTYYDIILPRPMQPDEFPQIQIRSVIDKSWLPINEAAIPSLFVAGIGSHVEVAAAYYLRNIIIAKITANQIRIILPAGLNGGASAWDGTTSTLRTWAAAASAADGFDRLRVKIAKNSAQEIPQPVEVNARRSVAQSITANSTLFSFDQKPVDTHGAFDGTVFIAPYSGWYLACAGLFYTSTTVVSPRLLAVINGVQQGKTISMMSSSYVGGGSRPFYLKAKDQLTFQSDSSFVLFAGFEIDIIKL
jgi:hypothetical protein